MVTGTVLWCKMLLRMEVLKYAL